MADRTPTPAASTRASKLREFSRATTPYLLGAVFASGVMAWYFFMFVPAKLQYFVGLRFRTLAVASGQVKSKAENLASSLAGGVHAVGVLPVVNAKTFTELAGTPLGQYLATLVPEIRLDPGSSSGLQLTAEKDATRVAASVAWDDVLRPAAAASARDFSDLILADASGQVVWQRDQTTPRIGNLKELLGAETQTSSWWSLSWQVQSTMPKASTNEQLPQTAFLKSVNLGGVSSFLLVQSVVLRPDGLANAPPTGARYFVAGLVPRQILQEQSMRIPVLWIVLVALPVALLFLALPFMKLLTLTPKERYSFADIVLLGAATVCAAGIGAMLFSGPASIDKNADKTLEGFAGAIEGRLAAETRQVLALADAIQSLPRNTELKACAVDFVQSPGRATRNRCGLWEVLESNKALLGPKAVAVGAIELDVVVWIDARGEQVRKWTTKAQVTGPASHRQFSHFRNVLEGRTWTLPESRIEFTIDPLRTPTTSEMGVVFALPITSTTVPDARILALNVRPKSVVDPIVPPGYGFAVIAPNGRVMFHSAEALSLEENFLEEVGNPSEVRDYAQSGHGVTWSGDYHGRRHRLHLQPVAALTGCPWRIVTFREMDPVFSAEIGQHSGVLRFGAINIALILGLTAIFWGLSHRNHRRASDRLLSAGAIRPLGSKLLGLLALIATGLLVWTYWPSSVIRFNWIYVFFALLPIITICLTFRARERFEQRPKTWHPGLQAGVLLLVLFLIAAAPAAAFARVEHMMQDSQMAQLWLEAAEDRWVGRYAGAVGRAKGPGYTSETQVLLLKDQGFAAPWRDGTSIDFSYLDVLTRVRVKDDAAKTTAISTGQDLPRWLLEWSLLGFKDVPATWQVKLSLDDPPSYRLKPDRPGLPTLSALLPSGIGHDITWRAGFGVALLIGTALAFIWARRRLYVFCDEPALDPKSQIAAVSPDGNEVVLLVGAPRTRKDQCASETVLSVTEKELKIRVPLLDAKLDEQFLERAATELDRLLTRTGKTLADKQGRVWIHVSNLEAQLTSSTSRALALRLLERLLERKPEATKDDPTKVLIVTTSIDPIANFEEVFHDERQGIYDDSIPEVELSRSSLLLSRFRRCYLPIGRSEARNRWEHWVHYNPKKWTAVLDAEVDGYEPLATIAPELKRAWKETEPVYAKELARAVMAKAEATYELLWTSCTRSEKLVLIQLAQEGLINPKSREVVAQLMAKGLIVRAPQPTVFNYSFRMFLRRIERHAVVDGWERMEGSGLWVTAGRLIGSSMLAGGLFFLMTQDFSVQSLLPIISSTGLFGLPFIRDVVARFSGGSGGSAQNA